MKNRFEVRDGVVDLADLELVSSYSGTWHASWNEATKSFYCEGNYRYPDGWGKLKLHRFVSSAPDGLDVDHRNHDTLNNRRHNIRLATRTLNNFNRRDRGKGARKVRGYSAWAASAIFKKKKIHLGTYHTPEAASAVSIAARAEIERLVATGESVDLLAIKARFGTDGRRRESKGMTHGRSKAA